MRLILLLFIFALVLVGCSVAGGTQVGKDITESIPTGNSTIGPPSSTDRTMKASQESQTSTLLENLGPAPELTNKIWINTAAPLRLADLRGNVVLLEMWTFG